MHSAVKRSVQYLQLAWEMLEVARSIYSKMGDEKALALAGDMPHTSRALCASTQMYACTPYLMRQAAKPFSAFLSIFFQPCWSPWHAARHSVLCMQC